MSFGMVAYQNCSQKYQMTIGKTPPAANSATNPSAPGAPNSPAAPSAPAQPQPTPPAAPAPAGTAHIYGQVVKATTNTILSGVLVKIIDTSGVVVAQTSTDSNGNYNFLNVALGTYSMLFTLTGYSNYTVSSPGVVTSGQNYNVNAALSPNLASGQVRIVLTWTAQKTGAVRDLDSFLLEPGAATNNPVFWNHKTGSYANLDIDQTNWLGPETMTITNPAAGTFTYYVVNYSDPSTPSAMGNSNSVVTVYDSSGLLKQYNIPSYSGGLGIVYEVFKITNGVITDRTIYDSPLWHCVVVPATGGSGCSY